MPGQYGGLYQNYTGATAGANGDCTTNGAAAAASVSGGGQADESSSGTTGRTSSMRARLIVPDRQESREKVHRIRATMSADGRDVDLRRDRALCVLGCCGRGRVMIVWSVSSAINLSLPRPG